MGDEKLIIYIVSLVFGIGIQYGVYKMFVKSVEKQFQVHAKQLETLEKTVHDLEIRHAEILIKIDNIGDLIERGFETINRKFETYDKNLMLFFLKDRKEDN